MDGSVPDALYLEERRRRLAAERTLEHTRRDLARAHSALVANADRLSRGYLAEREQNLRLTERQQAVLEQRREAAEKADRARRRLWHALEAMRDGFAVFDAGARLIAANHVWLDLFDAASAIAPGAHASEIFELAAEEGAFDIGDLAPAEWAAAQVARWDADEVPPLVLHHYDGRILRFLDRRAPDGDIVSLAIDVTEDRGREAALAAARDAAEDMARVKADFLARMSHEIRTPMNGVLGMAQMLVDEAEAGDPAARGEAGLYARTIRDSAESLLVIVNDTLDVSRLEAGRMDLRHEPFALDGLLCDCLRLAATQAAPGVETALAWPPDAPTRFAGDGGRVRQVVGNLLGNAIKFTTSGHVLLRAQVGTGDPARVVLTVEDTGPGIPPDRRAHVFEAFGQVDDPSRPMREGTGLGLTISRGLAERMGGTLDLRSRPGEGSTFVLSLPLALARDTAPPALPPPALPPAVAIVAGGGLTGRLLAEGLRGAGVAVGEDPAAGGGPVIVPLALDAAAQETALAALPPGARLVALGRRAQATDSLAARAAAFLADPFTAAELAAALGGGESAPAGPALPRVLLADDNATNRLLLDRILRGAPVAAEIVRDGQEAVDAFRARPAALVILDISMPRMDGFEAAAAIREIAGPGRPPIVALTAHVGDVMAARLSEAGFAAHLTKPLRKDVLLETLARHLPAGAMTP